MRRQRADLFEASISANKISIPQGQSYSEKKYYNGSEILTSNKSALCSIASLAFSFVLIQSHFKWRLALASPSLCKRSGEKEPVGFI